MNSKIRHSGVIEHVNEQCVIVRILQSSACSSCKVAAHCNASETKEKLIEVQTHDALSYQKGTRVMVFAETSVGYRASFYAYLLPLILMVSVLVLVLVLVNSEGMAAMASLGILVPYYFVLFLFQDKLKQKLSFEIE